MQRYYTHYEPQHVLSTMLASLKVSTNHYLPDRVILKRASGM